MEGWKPKPITSGSTATSPIRGSAKDSAPARPELDRRYQHNAGTGKRQPAQQ